MYRRLWTKMLVEWLYYTYKKWILVGREGGEEERIQESGFRIQNVERKWEWRGKGEEGEFGIQESEWKRGLGFR
jgi:hypothetical protein